LGIDTSYIEWDEVVEDFLLLERGDVMEKVEGKKV
jgi:hypothetical protein